MLPPQHTPPTPPRGRKWFVALGAAVVVLGIGAAVIYTRLSAPPPPTKPVTRQTLKEIIDVSGSVVAERDIVLRSEVSARILRLSAAENARVREGQPLLVFDTSNFQLQLQQARINRESSQAQARTDLQSARRALLDAQRKKGALLQQARTQLDKAERQVRFQEQELQRLSRLLAEGAVTAQSVDVQRQQRDQARLEARLARESLRKLQVDETEALAARSRISQAQTAFNNAARQGDIAERIAGNTLDKASLLAPFSGTVTHWEVDPGDYVTPGARLGTFQDLEEIYLLLAINELDFPKISRGAPVEIIFDAFAETVYRGEVFWLSQAGIQDKEGVNSFPVKVRFDNRQGRVKVGMSGDARILVAQKKDVLAIPISAVKKKEERYFVDILQDGQQKEVEIKPGISTLDSLEVRSGLKEGDALILEAPAP